MYTRVLALLSTVFLSLSSIQVGLLGVIFYHDLKLSNPIKQVEVYSVSPSTPGEVVNLNLNYKKKKFAREVIVDRWIACENGTSWKVQDLPPKRKSNHNLRSIQFEIPRNIEPDQTCLYGSRIRIPRIILPDIEIRVPPVDIPIRVVNPEVHRIQEIGPHFYRNR